MMGMSTMPSAQSLTDLMTLLQLLQAASDPKKSKAAIEMLQAERKVYDDAIALATEQTRQAGEAQNKALAAQEQALNIQASTRAEFEALTERKAQIDALTTQLEAVRDEVRSMKDDVDARNKAVDARVAALAKESIQAASAAKAERESIALYSQEAEAQMTAAVALRAEYEAKLAKIKALTE